MMSLTFFEHVVPYYLSEEEALGVLNLLGDYANPIDKKALDIRIDSVRGEINDYFETTCSGLSKILFTELTHASGVLKISVSVSRETYNLCNVNAGILTFQ